MSARENVPVQNIVMEDSHGDNTASEALANTQSQSDIHERPSRTPDIRLLPEHGDGYFQSPSEDVMSADSKLNHFFQMNREAFKNNSGVATSLRISPPSSDAANMLHDLQIKTDLQHLRRRSSIGSGEFEPRLASSASAASFTHRIPSVRSWLHSTAGSVSPGSTIGSPQIAAMLDITPLPSPTTGPLETWRLLARTRSRASSISSRATDLPLPGPVDTVHTSQSNASSSFSPSSPRKKLYLGLQSYMTRSSEDRSTDDDVTHARNRSISEYAPEPMIPSTKQRQHAVSGTGPPPDIDSNQPTLQREEFLGTQRGLTPAISKPTSPFQEDASMTESRDQPPSKRPKTEIYYAKSISRGMPRSYEQLRLLGQGTFSKVYLAVRMTVERRETVDYRQESTNMAGVRARSRRLVAVKVVEPGPAGGADAERIETSLKREVELMKTIQHPSIVHLKAFGTDSQRRALLVMNFCPGGDLFELASIDSYVFSPPLLRRIFSELVSAVRYLHQKYIVHRDIKLENILLNIPLQVHSDVPDWQTLDRAVVTLTDLGLSRTIPPPPESPLLSTRCGSEDYAAPEILMGQPYDGRQTDAWALGVVLYALMEGRLPFDALPGVRGDPMVLKTRTPHRIARIEWGWVRHGDEDNDWDATKGKDLEGARQCVEALLKRNTRRTPLADIRDWPWVRDGIQIDGGLRWVEEENM